MKRIGVTGSRGRIGQYLLKEGAVPLACDVTNPLEVQREIKYVRPDIVIHLAAKSDVDWCEDKKNEKIVIQTNVRGTFNVASVADQFGIPVILLSTDHVFDGKRMFGGYSEKSKPNAINFYGLSKSGAEALANAFDNMKIIRSSYLFDEDRLDPILTTLLSGGTVDAPTFLRRNFMYIRHFLIALRQYCDNIDSMPKILHLAGIDSVSYYDFYLYLRESFGFDGRINKRRDEIALAHRAHNLTLNVSLAQSLGFDLPSFIWGIKQMKEEEAVG